MIEIKIRCDHCGDLIKGKTIEEAYKKISIGENAFGTHICECCERVIIEAVKSFCSRQENLRR